MVMGPSDKSTWHHTGPSGMSPMVSGLDPNLFENDTATEELSQSAVPPEAFAAAWARARALPQRPIIQNNLSQEAQPDAGESPEPMFTPIVPPPIVSGGDWHNDFASGRIDALAPDPSDSNVIYAGGWVGLVKSADGGFTWTIKSNDWLSQSVTSIAIDPHAPSHVFVGTGSNGFGIPKAYGVGIYRSTTGGSSWDPVLRGNCSNCPTPSPSATPPNNVFEQTSIRKVVVDWHAPVATVFVINGPKPDNSRPSSFWKSTNDGDTWELLPYPPGFDSSTQIRDLAVDSSTNPPTIYIVTTGNGRGVFRSNGLLRDISDWTQICPAPGLTPNPTWDDGRARLALDVAAAVPYLIAPSENEVSLCPNPSPTECDHTAQHPNRLYYYSAPDLNTPASWHEIGTNCPANTVAEEYGCGICCGGDPISVVNGLPLNFAVSPFNPNIILLGVNGFFRTTSADAGQGATWENIRKQVPFLDIHYDQQAIAFSRATPGLVFVGNDGGIWKSTLNGQPNSWTNLNLKLPGALLYSVALSKDGSMIGGTQDNGSVFYDAVHPPDIDRNWTFIKRDGVFGIAVGGDAWGALIDNSDSNFGYYILFGSFHRYKRDSNRDDGVNPVYSPTPTPGISPAVTPTPLPCAYIWNRPPWSMNPLAPKRITAACNPLARTTDATRTPAPGWQLIYGLPIGTVPSYVAEAPNNPNVIYATIGNSVYVTTDANSTAPQWYHHVVASNPGINNIIVDPTNSAIAYLACDVGIFRTTDTGQSWGDPIAGTLNLLWKDVALDGRDTSKFFGGGDAGVYAGQFTASGLSWSQVGGIPQGLRVTSLSLNADRGQLVAGTLGRGVYRLNLDNEPPSVSITQPAPNSTVSGIITVKAVASDDRRVEGVTFTIDNNNQALAPEDTTKPYQISWNTIPWSSGVHTLRAVARDSCDNTTTSAAISVTVISIVKVILPWATFDTAVPVTTILTQPVGTDFIDSNLHYIGFEGDITYDSAVVNFSSPYVETSGLTSTNWGVAGNIINSGPGTLKTLRIAGRANDGDTALDGSGTLFNLKMVRVSQTPGTMSRLAAPEPGTVAGGVELKNFVFINNNLEPSQPDQTDGLITIGATPTASPTATATASAPPASPTATATATATAPVAGTPTTISGAISDCLNPPLQGATITLTGAESVSTQSNDLGNYTLVASLGGNYTVTPTKSANVPGSQGIDVIDTIAVQRHFLGITTLAGCQLSAADVNANGSVTTTDVLAINRFFLGYTTGIANVGQYKFTPVNRAYSPLTNDQQDQNYDAFIYGDVVH